VLRHDCPKLDFSYEVSLAAPRLGQLLAVWDENSSVPKAQFTGSTCWRYLRDREAPCVACPLFNPSPGAVPNVAVLACSSNAEYQLVETTRAGTKATVRVRRLEDSAIVTLCREKLRRMSEHARLSMQEDRVLALMARGFQSKEIACALGISVRTVKFHGTNLLRKLGADSRADILRLVVSQLPPSA
jgi:DNA-binding CsgD family transcriptional regulator